MQKQILEAFVAAKLNEMTSVLDTIEAQGYDSDDSAAATWPIWARERMHNIGACLQCAYSDLADLQGAWL